MGDERFGAGGGVAKEEGAAFIDGAGEGAEGDFGECTERAAGADHEAVAGVTGDVFDGASAGFDEGAGAIDPFHAED